LKVSIAATVEGMRSECERYFISGTIQGALHTALHATYHISRTLHHVPHTSHLIPHIMYHVPRTHARHANKGTSNNICELQYWHERIFSSAGGYPAPGTPPYRGGLKPAWLLYSISVMYLQQSSFLIV